MTATSTYSHNAPTRIIIKAKRDGKKVWYHWHIEQEGRWASSWEREKEGFVEPEPSWAAVEVSVFDYNDCNFKIRTSLSGSAKTHFKAEVQARVELAKVIAFFNEEQRNEEWTEANTTVLDT